ncbi:MAG: thiamine-phosphate kinase [Helicobacter sp.]|nr:thiamine-phosphate kinase [Helicobacter sp.]
MRDREKAFIQALKASGETYGIGDDGVVLGDFVIASDMFFEGIHFKREWGSLETLIEKCFCVNCSDIYAMNAIPKYAIINLSFPKDFFMPASLAQIFAKIAKKYQIKIIGGDTCVGERLHISLTLLALRGKKTLWRKGIKKGDWLCTLTPNTALIPKNQRLGKVKNQLKNALRYNHTSKQSRFMTPLLLPQMIFTLNRIARAGMDISDGIALELSRLATLNKIDFKIHLKKGDWFDSPEEYQMLYAFSPKLIKKAQNLARKYRHKLIIFGRAKRGIYKTKQRNHHS